MKNRSRSPAALLKVCSPRLAGVSTITQSVDSSCVHTCGALSVCVCGGFNTTANVSIKRFLKRNLADVGMKSMADKAHKQGMPHSDMHFITWPHYSTTIPT